MSPRISMITLGVRNLEVATNFYEQGLGFPRKKSSPDIAFFTLNGTWLLSTTGMLSQEMLELIHPELVLEDLPYPIMFRLRKR